jgi:hypothetical protein
MYDVYVNLPEQNILNAKKAGLGWHVNHIFIIEKRINLTVFMTVF